jgi:acetylornithine deacetylase/succinyl-diaminopimelate desuccinylase-like protein
VRRLIAEATPPGAELELELVQAARPGVVDVGARAFQLGLDAFERAIGTRPLLTRVGGTMPVLATLTDRGLPTILTGFGLLESNVHAPNERMPTDFVPLGISTVKELFVSLGELG